MKFLPLVFVSLSNKLSSVCRETETMNVVRAISRQLFRLICLKKRNDTRMVCYVSATERLKVRRNKFILSALIFSLGNASGKLSCWRKWGNTYIVSVTSA